MITYDDRPIVVTIETRYEFLFLPPEPIPDSKDVHSDFPIAKGFAGPFIDFSRLLIQWVLVAIATAAIVLILKDERECSDTRGGTAK
jgi:hypothetical protein